MIMLEKFEINVKIQRLLRYTILDTVCVANSQLGDDQSGCNWSVDIVNVINVQGGEVDYAK